MTFRVASIEVPGVRFRVLRFGTQAGTRAPLVLLHGFTGGAVTWAPIANTLAMTREVVAVDLPGHGATRTSGDAFSFEAQARSLAALCDSLQSPVHLLGYSMGGRLALAAALLGRARLSSLTCVSAHPGLASAAERQERKTSDDAWVRLLSSTTIESFAEKWEAQPLFQSRQAVPVPLKDMLRAAIHAQKPRQLAAALSGAGLGEQPELRRLLAGLSVPFLSISGALDAKFRPLADEMAALAPLGRHTVITRAGHAPQWENPQAFVEAVAAFCSDADQHVSTSRSNYVDRNLPA